MPGSSTGRYGPWWEGAVSFILIFCVPNTEPMRQILPGTYSISILPIFLSNRIPIGQHAYLKTFTSPGFFEAQVPRDLVWTNETQVEFYRVGFWKSHCFPDNGSQMALGLWPFIFHHPHPILPPGNLDSTPRGGATIL